MTISSETRKAGPFPGNGVTTAFPFAFKVFLAADLAVTLNVLATGVQTLLTLTSDYTVALNPDQNANPGGTVTYNPSGVPMPSTKTLTIGSALTNTQGYQPTNSGGWLPSNAGDAWDRAVILIQQVSEKVTRSLKFPIVDGALTAELPPAAQRANNLLGFDASGNVVAVAPAAQSATALQTLLALFSGSSLIGWIQSGVGAVLRLVQDKLRENVSLLDFVQPGEIGVDYLPAFNRAIVYLKSIGGGVLTLPNGALPFSAGIVVTNANSITLKGAGSYSNPDLAFNPATQFLFAPAITGTGLKIITSAGFNINDLSIYGTGLTAGIETDRLTQSTWHNVDSYASVADANAYGYKFTTTSATLHDNNMMNVYTNLRTKARNGIQLTGVASIANVCHETFINTVINHENGIGIALDVCDNVSWHQTFIFRRAGTGVGVRWRDTPGDANSIYFYHLQSSAGGIDTGVNCLYPGAVFGYDMSNGQPLPTSGGTGQIFSITTDGFNSLGWEVPRRNIRKFFNFYNAGSVDGEIVRDDNGYGERWYTSTSGLSSKRFLDNAKKALTWNIVPDGVLANGHDVVDLYADRMQMQTKLVEAKAAVTAGTTPDVKHINILEAFYAGAVTITNFINGAEGQIVRVQNVGVAPTLQHGATIKLAGSVNFVFNATFMSSITLELRAGVWFEVGRSQL